MARTNLHLILERLIEDYAPRIRDAFLLVMTDVADSVILADMIEAVKNGDPDRAFRLVGLDDAALRPILAVIEDAFTTGGTVTAESFPKRIRTVNGAKFRFDVRTPRAERWLREESAQKLVGDIKAKAMTTIRDTLSEGVRKGANPREVALDLVGRIDRTTGHRTGGTLALTPGQNGWAIKVENSLRELDRSYFTRELRDKRFDDIVARAIDSGTPLPESTIQKLTSRYRDNALRYRGEVVGRSEAIESLNRSQQESLTQAVENGAIKKRAIKRYWDSAGDDGRTRDSHLAMEKQTTLAPVGLDEPFAFPSGANLMFPGDRTTATGDGKAIARETVQCRCRVRIDIDFFDGVT